MDCCTPHWTVYLTALGTPIIASIAAWIAFRQSQIAQDKVKFDFYDKRMAIYETVRATLVSAYKGKLTTEEQLNYFMNARSARWLYGQAVFQYLNETLWNKIVDIEFHTTQIEQTSGGERTEHIYAQTEIKHWIMAQHKEFDKLCAPDLTLKQEPTLWQNLESAFARLFRN